jgi:multisubunit Na+/H+ antiporter MnhF subunit
MNHQIEILIPIILFISMAVVLYHFIKSRHAERMAVISNSLSEEQLAFFKKAKVRSENYSLWTAKIAVLLIGVGLAILIGNLAPYQIQDEIILSLIFLLPGIGLLLVYRFLEYKNTNPKKTEN